MRIGETTTEQVTVVADEFGGASVVGAEPETHVLPFPVPIGLLRDYVRPQIDFGTWLDDEGRPIEYGERWVEPPSEMYSACRHPERFEPLLITARALLDHLERKFDVDRADIVRGERTHVILTPRSGDGTVLAMKLPDGSLPSVKIRAGYQYRESWPDCGCDACDDFVPALLDELETMVFAIVEGLTEVSGWTDGEPEPRELPTTPHQWGPWPIRTG